MIKIPKMNHKSIGQCLIYGIKSAFFVQSLLKNMVPEKNLRYCMEGANVTCNELVTQSFSASYHWLHQHNPAISCLIFEKVPFFSVFQTWQKHLFI